MGRVVVSKPDEFVEVPFPRLAGIAASGSIRTQSVIAGHERPLVLWMHELAPHARIRCDAPLVDHLFYVWEGRGEVAEAGPGGEAAPLEPEGVLIVEREGRSELTARASGAVLLHFHRNESTPSVAPRPGGGVHVLDAKGFLQMKQPTNGDTFTWWADSACRTCEVWFHQQICEQPRAQVGGRHFHSADEIVVVRNGSMALGKRMLGPGSALAVDKNTLYTFGVPEGGLTFINFRTDESTYVRVSSKNEPLHPPLIERELLRVIPRLDA